MNSRMPGVWLSVVVVLCWAGTGCVTTAAHSKVVAELAGARKDVERLEKKLDRASSDLSRARIRAEAALKKSEQMKEGWT